MMIKWFLTAILITTAATLSAAPVEVGKVKWGRDIAKAMSDSKTSGKPVFLLFQEVPG